MSEARGALLADLLAFVDRPTEAAFDALALRVLAWQAEAVPAYGCLVAARGGPRASWVDWPLVPTPVFRELDLSTGADAAAVFRTSGTTGAGRRGERRVPDLTLYHAGMWAPFVGAVLAGDTTRRRWLSLVPAAATSPDSSLAHMVDRLAVDLATDGAPTHALTPAGLDTAAAWAWLRAATEPVVVLATSFALATLLAAEPDARVALPTGSRLMLTGGFKGHAAAWTEDDLVAVTNDRLGLPPDASVPEYGMTELTSQAYGRPLVAPPWLRLRVVDPVTASPLPAGEVGLVAPFDLLSLDNVSALLTHDLGLLDDAGRLTLAGRAPGSVRRGCSLTAEELGVLA